MWRYSLQSWFLIDPTMEILYPPITGHTIYNHFLSQLSRLLDCTEVQRLRTQVCCDLTTLVSKHVSSKPLITNREKNIFSYIHNDIISQSNIRKCTMVRSASEDFDAIYLQNVLSAGSHRTKRCRSRHIDKLMKVGIFQAALYLTTKSQLSWNVLRLSLL